MKILIEGDQMTKEDLIKIGQFMTEFFKGRKDIISFFILEGTNDLSKDECVKLIIKMFKEEPEFKMLFEVKKDGK